MSDSVDLRLQTRLMQSLEVDLMEMCLLYRSRGLSYDCITKALIFLLPKVVVKTEGETGLEGKA